MSRHFLLQGIFPTQGWNPRLLRWQGVLYHWVTREASVRRLWSFLSLPCLWLPVTSLCLGGGGGGAGTTSSLSGGGRSTGFHLAVGDPWGGTPLYCWAWVGVWLCTRPVVLLPLWVDSLEVFMTAPLTASLTCCCRRKRTSLPPGSGGNPDTPLDLLLHFPRGGDGGRAPHSWQMAFCWSPLAAREEASLSPRAMDECPGSLFCLSGHDRGKENGAPVISLTRAGI